MARTTNITSEDFRFIEEIEGLTSIEGIEVNTYKSKRIISYKMFKRNNFGNLVPYFSAISSACKYGKDFTVERFDSREEAIDYVKQEIDLMNNEGTKENG